MPEVETYVARGGRGVVAAGLLAAADAMVAIVAPVPSYSIIVRFLGGLSETQKAAFKAAADRWTGVITGALPHVNVDGELIEGLLIEAQGQDIDGPGRVLGMAGPTHLRPAVGPGAQLPVKGVMTFDSADLDQMETRGTLNDVITHEMGHVIGIGTIWGRLSLITGAGTANPEFVGDEARREFGVLKGGGPLPVPVENTGGQGTRDGHWRDIVFGNELMTGFVGNAGNPLSRLTVGSLIDMGYVADLAKAEPYTLPSLESLAMIGALGAAGELEADHTLGTIPMTLPPESIPG